ncbi:2S seed storage protein 3 [Cardamine amara subsp. amara]|uniref:2S seed storage protein 3 n=1 Tax=Cardamine amara subsp. amara TaxID=228776 RepID=A0ABD1ATJ9_CARAN
MANKLFLVCTALALCFLLTNASIYRTVVEEFDEDDETNPMGPRPKCRKEFQQAQHLRACQRWIKRQMREGPMDDEVDFEDDMENPQGGPQQPRQLLHQCCNELREEEPECVCPTLKRAARAVRLQGQHGPFQSRKIYRTARNLPQVCNIPQVDVCPFRAGVPFFPPSY